MRILRYLKRGKTKDQIESERLHEEERRKYEQTVQRGTLIDLFSGSLKEYESLKEEEYVVIDSGRSDKSVYIGTSPDRNGGQKPELSVVGEIWLLGELNAEALIRYQALKPAGAYYSFGSGIPVKRKNKTKKL